MEKDPIGETTFASGQMVAGKYRVERTIGQGGMGVVLAAEHVALRQQVAIKLLRTAALAHTDVVGRFVREARAAVRLRSEHVARVIDVGTLEDGRPYIVMERLEGEDLGDLIERGPLPVHVAVDYVIQACEAIAEAHAAGIIHRDLKPKNLFLTRAVHGKPLVKVLDFGISKIDAPQEMQLTRTTEVIGSPSYMSPEQLRSSRNVDPRTDIWALGVILYELLTGRLPFVAETITELVLVVVNERETPVQLLRPEVPPHLAGVISNCLQKHPDHRYQSIADLVQALEPFAQAGYTTAADRIRAVAGSSSGNPIVPAPFPSSGSTLPGGGARVNVHAGTSVAWGETHSQVGPMPPLPPRRTGLIVGLAAGLVTLIGVTGLVLFLALRPKPQPPVALVAAPAESAMPLPPGRKDLPPMPSASIAEPAPAPAPRDGDKDRKPAAKPAAPRPAVSPAPPKDDLKDMGRK